MNTVMIVRNLLVWGQLSVGELLESGAQSRFASGRVVRGVMNRGMAYMSRIIVQLP